MLIEERDRVLDQLEVAETRYVSSFKISTPDPSLADMPIPQPPPKDDDELGALKRTISRPRALIGSSSVSRTQASPPRVAYTARADRQLLRERARAKSLGGAIALLPRGEPAQRRRVQLPRAPVLRQSMHARLRHVPPSPKRARRALIVNASSPCPTLRRHRPARPGQTTPRSPRSTDGALRVRTAPATR